MWHGNVEAGLYNVFVNAKQELSEKRDYRKSRVNRRRCETIMIKISLIYGYIFDSSLHHKRRRQQTLDLDTTPALFPFLRRASIESDGVAVRASLDHVQARRRASWARDLGARCRRAGDAEAVAERVAVVRVERVVDVGVSDRVLVVDHVVGLARRADLQLLACCAAGWVGVAGRLAGGDGACAEDGAGAAVMRVSK